MTTLHLSWPANPASELVTEYHVHRSVDGGAFSLFRVVVGATTTDIVDPAPGLYSFLVKASNFVGISAESPVVTGPGVPTAPGQPTLTVTVS